MPWCLGTSGSVRARRIPHSARWAAEVHTFWPVTTHSSPSSTARVATLARSEPASGSLKSWHHTSSPRSIGGQVALLLLVGAVGEQRGADHADGDGEHAVGHAEAGLLLVEDRRLDRACRRGRRLASAR